MITARHPDRAKRCPVCKAKPGEPCINGAGTKAGWTLAPENHVNRTRDK